METMQALVVNSQSDAPRLEQRELPMPVPKPHEIVVRVAACGICYHDVAVVNGTLRRGVKPDVVLGHEVSGYVHEVGDGVTAIQPGERVVTALTTFCGECLRCTAGNQYRCVRGRGFGHGLDGGFAQYMLVPEASAIPIPDNIDIVDAALFGCPIGVAINALEDAAQLRSGETALVVGAGGGLGVHLAQVAAAMGARVFAITTSPDKLGALETLQGVEALLAESELDFSEIVLALTEDNGSDVALNPVGSALFNSCLASMAQFGRMVVLGEVAGRAARFNLAELLFRDAIITGATGASPRHIYKAIDLVSSGAVQPVVSQQCTFDDAAMAIEDMQAARTFGRVAIIPPA
ncbi:MAG: alcohol dehydrogenase catalytic domain-containing protein [Chloroflexi bacterium]|nr:alcohol dehydrogenase catalytic domain-containing protein [Chloroflexota bacterium]